MSDFDDVARRFGSPLSLEEPALPDISPESMQEIASLALGYLEEDAPSGVEVAVVTDATGITVKVFAVNDLELLDTTRLWWSDDVDCRIYQEALIGNLDWYLLTGHIAVKVATARQAATLAVGVRDRWIVQLEDRPYSVGDVPPGLAEYYDGPQEEPFK